MLTEEERQELSAYEYPFENVALEGGGVKGSAYIGAIRVSNLFNYKSQKHEVSSHNALRSNHFISIEISRRKLFRFSSILVSKCSSCENIYKKRIVCYYYLLCLSVS